MKRVLVQVMCAILLIGAAAAQRLPETAVPENYKLAFAPDFTKDNFAGEETLSIRVLKPTSEIVLNAAQIDFQEVTVTSGGSSQKAKVTLDDKKEMATLAFDKTIQPGPATIRVRFTGILNNELRGFYLGKDDQGRKYAATQFEATDARRAFPSFDEPNYKATFDITVTADKDMTVISNSKAISDTPSADRSKHTVRFATTPKMSSYLAAMVVGNFEYIEGSSDGIPIRVYTSPGKKELGTFALQAAENFMRYYNHYFGIKYPYGKLDMIGLADFAAGAMENTACITYRESFLLLDDKRAGVEVRKNVASGVAHEMAHQWFGDLVTMKWWDDIWLNEGFATWMSSKPLEAWKPEWNVQLDDVNDLGQSLNADSLVNTHPIHQDAETPAQILELADGITYGKTAAVLRMLEFYLGPETFRAGVNAYLKKHAYGNATAADFWGAQTEISRKPVDKLMPTFVQQPGAPFVNVKTQCSGNQETVSVGQQRYFYDRSRMDQGGSELWQIPLCVKDSNAQKGKEHCELLTQKENSFVQQGCSPWLFANADAKGFYRSGYSPEAVGAMAKAAEISLNPAERIMLLSDVWASVRVGREPIGDYLAVAEGLRSDRTLAVLDQMFPQLDFIGRYLVDDADRSTYELWLRQLLAPMVKEVGWESKAGETAEQIGLRVRLLHLLGYTARDPEVGALARKWADQAMDNPTSVNDEIADESLRIAALSGDAAFYDKIMAHLKTAKTPEEYYAYQGALASFTDSKLLQRTLDFAMSPESRSQDSMLLIGRIMRNPAGQALTWDFVRSNWSSLEKAAGTFGGGGGSIVGSTGTFCDVQQQEEVKDFFTTHSAPATERTLKQALERIGYCVDIKQRQSPLLATWLGQQTNQSGQ